MLFLVAVSTSLAPEGSLYLTQRFNPSHPYTYNTTVLHQSKDMDHAHQ